jgi:hypothetical protein
MAKKCSFIDCNNPADKKGSVCQTCKERKENKICSACRQPEPQNEILHFQPSFVKFKKGYQFLKKLREKVPAQFRSQIDQVSIPMKLSQGEEKLIEEVEKKVLDFLAEKGGQQDNFR